MKVLQRLLILNKRQNLYFRFMRRQFNKGSRLTSPWQTNISFLQLKSLDSRNFLNGLIIATQQLR